MAVAERARPPSQKRTFGCAAKFLTQCERLPRNVPTRMCSPTRSEANGTFDNRPVLRPVVSRTINAPGASDGDPKPFRTDGSSTAFSARKSRASVVPGRMVARLSDSLRPSAD